MFLTRYRANCFEAPHSNCFADCRPDGLSVGPRPATRDGDSVFSRRRIRATRAAGNVHGSPIWPRYASRRLGAPSNRPHGCLSNRDTFLRIVTSQPETNQNRSVPKQTFRHSGRRRFSAAVREFGVFLPAVSAISPIAAIPAATPAAPTPPSVSSAPASVTTTAAPAPAAAAFGLRTRFVYHEVPSTEILAVQRVYSAIGVFIIGNFDEGETARLSRETVTNEIDTRGSNTDLREPFLHLLFRSGKRKVTHVKLLHLPTPSARNPNESRGAR